MFWWQWTRQAAKDQYAALYRAKVPYCEASAVTFSFSAEFPWGNNSRSPQVSYSGLGRRCPTRPDLDRDGPQMRYRCILVVASATVRSQLPYARRCSRKTVGDRGKNYRPEKGNAKKRPMERLKEGRRTILNLNGQAQCTPTCRDGECQAHPPKPPPAPSAQRISTVLHWVAWVGSDLWRRKSGSPFHRGDIDVLASVQGKPKGHPCQKKLLLPALIGFPI